MKLYDFHIKTNMNGQRAIYQYSHNRDSWGYHVIDIPADFIKEKEEFRALLFHCRVVPVFIKGTNKPDPEYTKAVRRKRLKDFVKEKLNG